MAAVTRKDVASVLHASTKGIVIDLEVSPGAKFTKLSSINQWRKRLDLSVKAPPRKGEANKAVAKFLSEVFRVPINYISIIAGATSSQKRVEIAGVSIDYAIDSILSALTSADKGDGR